MAEKNEDPYWRRGYEGSKKATRAFLRGPKDTPPNPFEYLKIPFRVLAGPFHWLIFILLFSFGLLMLIAVLVFFTQAGRQGILDIYGTEAIDFLAGIPGVSRIAPLFKETTEVIVDPSKAVVRSSNSQWKSTVEATEVDKDLGLEFVISPNSDRNLYFTNEKIKARTELAIKIPKAEGEDSGASTVKLGCLGETSGESKEGIIEDNQRTVRKGEVSFISVECEFPENTFEVESNLIQAENKLQNLKIKFFVDYEFSSFTFWPVYTKKDEKIRQDRSLGNDPFEGINDRFIRDREKGIVSSQPSKAPMRIVLGGIGQPYSDKSGDGEGFNFMGVSFEEYARYKNYAPGVREGVVREIRDMRIRVPENFALDTEEGSFIDSGEDTKETGRKEYVIKKEELANLNSRCERLGIKKEVLPGYLSRECFDALSREQFTTSTSFRVDFLETESLSVSEITARADYVYEVYDTLNVRLRKPGAVA